MFKILENTICSHIVDSISIYVVTILTYSSYYNVVTYMTIIKYCM